MSMIINPFLFAAAGGGVPDFPTLTDIWEWWEPDRSGFADNDAIATLPGQVLPGAGHDFTQGTVANRPTYKAGIINGAGVARFDGANDFLGGVNPSALTAAHLWIVVNVVAPTGGNGALWDFGTAASQNHYVNPGDNLIYDGSCSDTRRNVGAPGVSITTWRVIEVVSVSGKWTYQLDGTQLFTTATNTVAIKTDCRIGEDNTNERECDIAGVYLCSAEMTTERATLVSYLTSRWSLSIS